jgi:hypothetical protein
VALASTAAAQSSNGVSQHPTQLSTLKLVSCRLQLIRAASELAIFEEYFITGPNVFLVVFFNHYVFTAHFYKPAIHTEATASAKLFSLYSSGRRAVSF